MSYFLLQEDLERLFGRPVDLVRSSWGEEITDTRREPRMSGVTRHDDGKAVAALDLADRIRKPRTVELRTLTPDQLLDLLTDDHPAS